MECPGNSWNKCVWVYLPNGAAFHPPRLPSGPPLPPPVSSQSLVGGLGAPLSPNFRRWYNFKRNHDVLWSGVSAKQKGTRGPIDRALGHRGGTCLFFLMRKDKPEEQKKQFNSHSILMKPHAVLESKWQVWLQRALDRCEWFIHLCLLHSDFLLSAIQYPSPISVQEFTLVACLEYVLKD